MSERSAVSWLFVPATRPDRFDKALASGADATILDLEDAVGVEQKETAREHARAWLHGGGGAWVRINGAGTPWHEDDLEVLAGSPGLCGIVVPKAEEPEWLISAAGRVGAGAGLVALVETARGVRDAASIAACPVVDRLAFGSIDFALDIEAEHTPDALSFARGALVVASRSAGLPGPLDGVTVEVGDAGVAVTSDAARARTLGFGGKLCIHPDQVAVVNHAFAPRTEDVDWARRVLAAARDHDGAFTMDGKMVDRPLVERARRVLASAGVAEA